MGCNISSLVYILLFFNLFLTGYEVEGGRSHGNNSPNHNVSTTIQAVYGDMYDCIDVHKQHSLSHPALRDHKIRMRPSERHLATLRKTSKNPNYEFSPEKLWKLRKGCPEGTVPIHGSTRSYNYSKDDDTKFSQNSLGTRTTHGSVEFAGIRSKPGTGMTFNGASALMNIQNPKVGADQYSSAMISIERESNQIQVGWTVNPKLYGDYQTRLYTSWTSDNHGCYNTLCSGFIMVSNDIPLGFVFNDSIYEGQQFEFYFFIFQEPGVGWWLYVHDWLHPVGYWPLSLFTSLQQNASCVRFGGEAFTPPSEDVSPQMGSGIYDDTYKRTCYMRQVTVILGGDKTAKSPDNSYMDKVETRCYFMGANSYNEQHQEYSFYFGGTGGKDQLTCLY